MATIINVSQLELRRNLGILGITLPLVLVVGNKFHIENSLSAFYYTNMSVYFTGVLFAFGMFLFSYKGYTKEKEKFSDNLITNIAGVLAIITALIPAKCYSQECPYANSHHSQLLGGIHFGSAAIFFLITAWMSYFRFTKRDDNIEDPEIIQLKNKRNWIFKICGIGILVTLVLLALAFLFDPDLTGFDTFLGETIVLIFFGSAWLVKAKALKKFGL
jgi:hypothetical protein